jgi:hypothetical protein
MFMSNGIAEKAALAVRTPEVERMILQLSEYGLGVCVPHMHDPITNELIALPSNMVQTEAKLQVSFVEREKIDFRQVPVAWVCDNELRTVQHCAICQPPDGPHH